MAKAKELKEETNKLEATSNVIYPKDKEEELDEMVEFYAKDYSEVYLIRDLTNEAVVAVEGFPANSKSPIVERNGRKVNCICYKERLLSSRQRFDFACQGKKMIGYESVYGNDTRLGKHEIGIVAKKIATPATVSYESLGGYSPFEKYKQQAAVEVRQAASEDEPDYELIIKPDGLTYERFETFAVDRMK